MAIFGKLTTLKNQLIKKEFQSAFNYLENITNDFLLIKENECIKEMIDGDIFVLKQAYYTKDKKDCFFESHKKYIDIQYIVKGEEIMNVSHIDDLKETKRYDEKIDFIEYSRRDNVSSLHIKEKELAIFYPEDGHQPCIKTNKSELIYKAVIKIPVDKS